MNYALKLSAIPFFFIFLVSCESSRSATISLSSNQLENYQITQHDLLLEFKRFCDDHDYELTGDFLSNNSISCVKGGFLDGFQIFYKPETQTYSVHYLLIPFKNNRQNYLCSRIDELKTYINAYLRIERFDFVSNNTKC